MGKCDKLMMEQDMAQDRESQAVLPVYRSKEEARQFYDCISRLYDYVAGTFERRYSKMALERLSVQSGEIVLEIGFGSGHCLKRIAELVGHNGRAYGIDISSGMLQVTKRRLGKANLLDRVELYCDDATKLPYEDNTFDAVFMSFTLELFDAPEIHMVLDEVRRTLKPVGRLGIVSLSRSYGEPISLRLYEWAHKKWPKYVDCRPIYLEKSLIGAGYEIQSKKRAKLVGLPLEIIIATKG
jgi:demethylmenaquinone methyltransferase/2-methoxy-6-polyprenyl-1,4-benzoquinol methylase